MPPVGPGVKSPTVYGGTVESIRAAADLVAQGRCLYCVPSSCISALPGTTWWPLTEPASYYPWSVLWRAAASPAYVRAVVSCAQAMSKRLGWLAAAGEVHNENRAQTGTPPRVRRHPPRCRERETTVRSV